MDEVDVKVKPIRSREYYIFIKGKPTKKSILHTSNTRTQKFIKETLLLFIHVMILTH